VKKETNGWDFLIVATAYLWKSVKTGDGRLRPRLPK